MSKEQWIRVPKREGIDLADRWRLGDWVLTCQIIYGEHLGGGGSWRLSRFDGRPIRSGQSVGLFLAHWDHLTKDEPPLEKAAAVIRKNNPPVIVEKRPKGPIQITAWFAALMVSRLAEEESEWDLDSMSHLLERLGEEVEELDDAVFKSQLPADIIAKAVGVANRAMMIADNVMPRGDRG